MKTDVNGHSTCEAGQEQWEAFLPSRGAMRIQYDYRTPDGRLFSCIARDLADARAKLARWTNIEDYCRRGASNG